MKRNTLHYGDCLEVMRAWPNDCVDLIYLDPPFNSNANYNILFGNKKTKTEKIRRKDLAQMVAFTDTWEWNEKTAKRIKAIRCTRGRRSHGHRARKAIMALDSLYESGTGMLAYLVYMADRINEMHRILKDTGSLYLHCDPTASHYLKMIMDDVFGVKNFRNEIIWLRNTTAPKGSQHKTKTWGSNSDTILFYAKPKSGELDNLKELSKQEINERFPHTDDAGRYQIDTHLFRPPGLGARPNLCYTWKGITNPNPSGWQLSKQRLQDEYDKGRIGFRKNGRPFRKKYLADFYGDRVGNVWNDIQIALGKERLGYPTQKPLALLERIIKASSNKGEVVLDPFCGCGTTIEAAMKLRRDFIGIDISMYALDVIQKERLQDVKFKIDGVPTDMQTAAHMATNQPFAFEKWAIHRIPGFVANNRQVGDGGIDGWAGLLNTPEDEDGICIAQVKGGKPSVDSLRAFTNQLTAGYASVGVFITLKKWDTPTVRKCAADAGTLKQGANEFNRLVMWSIEQHFGGIKPSLPPLAHPRTGHPLQEDLMVSEASGIFQQRNA